MLTVVEMGWTCKLVETTPALTLNQTVQPWVHMQRERPSLCPGSIVNRAHYCSRSSEQARRTRKGASLCERPNSLDSDPPTASQQERPKM